MCRTIPMHSFPMVFVPTVLRNSIPNKPRDYGTDRKNKHIGSAQYGKKGYCADRNDDVKNRQGETSE